MIYDFSDKKNQKNMMETKLQKLKTEYEKPQMSAENLEDLRSTMRKARKENRKERDRAKLVKFAAAAAVLAGAFIILPNLSYGIANAMEQIPLIGSLSEAVTFRNYEVESQRNTAKVEIPEINPKDLSADSQVQENLERSAEEINAEIEKNANELVEHFKKHLADEEGYQDIVVKSEVLKTTPDYFTLKLMCYQGAGSGTQWNYYYTIDLNTGERLKLKELFREGTDYITPISENIKKQMEEQMDADDRVYYWLHDEIAEWNFQSITDETSFYVNESGNIVIAFDEGEVAPMYMGTVEFEIPAGILQDILK